MLIVQYIGILASISIAWLAWQGLRAQRLTLGEAFTWLVGSVLGIAFSSMPSAFTLLAGRLGFARLSDLISTSILIMVTLLLLLQQHRIARLEARLTELARRIAQEDVRIPEQDARREKTEKKEERE